MDRIDALLARARARKGILHSSELRTKGFTAREMSAAVSAGLLRRVRRSWLATPECDERRVRAASVGGRVTCLTAARMNALWVPGDAELVHLAVPGTASRFDAGGCRIHWSSGPAAVARSTVDDHPLNVLFHVARCVSLEDAAMVWESAIRTSFVQQPVLARVQWRSDAAHRLAAISSALSDSGIETRFVSIMRVCGVTVRQQARVDGRDVDALIGERLLVQIDGFAHHRRAADRRRDIAADVRLTLRGYTVLRFDYWQILFTPDEVRDAVVLAMAQGMHLPGR